MSSAVSLPGRMRMWRTDDVRRVRERDLAAAEADAAAGSGLTRDRDVALDRHRGDELDVAADVEHDEAVRGADGVAERAGAGVVEVGDVIDGAVASARHVLAETLRAGERERRPLRAGGPGRAAAPGAAGRARAAGGTSAAARARAAGRSGGAAAPRSTTSARARPRSSAAGVATSATATATAGPRATAAARHPRRSG